MDISSIKKNCTMEQYDFNAQKEKLLDKLGNKNSLFSIRNESDIVVATYLPYDLEFVYIPEGKYNKGLSVKERQQAREINKNIIFEEQGMNVENGIFVSDILVTRTPILNSFAKKYIDFRFYEGEEKYAAYLKKESVDSLCLRLNLRLPTEIEWEYFVRAGSDDLFSFGKQLPNDAELEKWLSFDFSDLSCVNCNNFGLYGIYTGDWCSDYYKTSDCELEDKEYVIRGGGAYFWPWQADEWIWCMSAMRMSSKGLVDGECGMRLVYDLDSN